jgi:polysaccharide biosynthesis/export protein
MGIVKRWIKRDDAIPSFIQGGGAAPAGADGVVQSIKSLLLFSMTLILPLVVLLICSSTLPAQSLEPPKPDVTPFYLIQPNDVLQIYVWKDPTMSQKVTVRPDGRISFPLVQDVQAAGLSTVQLKAALEEGLKQYVEFPNVTVIVDAILSYKVYVIGKVAKPGAYLDVKPMNVLQALSLAGPFAEFADIDRIVIIRGSGEDSNLFKFNFSEVIQSKNFSQNFLLKNGDVVVVP